MFSRLPQEIQEAIILEALQIKPSLVASLAQTSKSLFEIICQPKDGHLWRSIFLSVFDDPRKIEAIVSGLDEAECWFDWYYEARQRFRAQIRMDRATIIELADFNKVIDDDAADALWEVAHTSSPASSDSNSYRNGPWLAECFRSAINASREDPGTRKASHPRFISPGHYLCITHSARKLQHQVHEIGIPNQWGPWLPGSHGAANWIHVWHLLDVLRHNAHERGCLDLPSRGIENLRAYSVPKTPLEDLPAGDWAGVEGVWLRAVSFMDYRDLHAYNFSGTQRPDGSYSTNIFQNIQFAEAFRLIKAYFTVVKVDEKGPPAYPHRPTIHFVGDMGAADGDYSHVITKGTVSMTKHGHIQWSFWTRVGGHQWASEGVQLGNVQSKAGVIGVWSSAVHEVTDPAGPFWLWKCDEGKGSPEAPHMHHYGFTN